MAGALRPRRKIPSRTTILGVGSPSLFRCSSFWPAPLPLFGPEMCVGIFLVTILGVFCTCITTLECIADLFMFSIIPLDVEFGKCNKVQRRGSGCSLSRAPMVLPPLRSPNRACPWVAPEVRHTHNSKRSYRPYRCPIYIRSCAMRTITTV